MLERVNMEFTLEKFAREGIYVEVTFELRGRASRWIWEELNIQPKKIASAKALRCVGNWLKASVVEVYTFREQVVWEWGSRQAEQKLSKRMRRL